MYRTTLVSSSVTLALAAPALAALEKGHADVWVTSSGGRLVTGGWDHETGEVTNPAQRVFEAELGIDPAFPFSGDEPGIGSDLVGSALTMNLLAGLGSWNGAGFDAAPGGLLASYAGQDALSTSGGSFGFLVTPGLDLHPEFTVFGGDGNDPANGIYLAAFTVSSAGRATSETFWIVFNLGMGEAEHEAAVEWVESNLVPAPGALAVAALAAVTGARSRTRRR